MVTPVTGLVTAWVQASETGAMVSRVSLWRPRWPLPVGSGVPSARVWLTRRSFDHVSAALRCGPGASVDSNGAVRGPEVAAGVPVSSTWTRAAWERPSPYGAPTRQLLIWLSQRAAA